ncbi:hypothetical protein T484DRAFT_1756190 [Baffinella frigidus]|nr:hypothetical protein T484DRAFT_1756190 [Cryptophyta sp. CCMP2293]
MSRRGGVIPYQQPSCITEHFISIWIWMREQLDSEIRNHTTAMIAESNLLSVRDNIEKNKSKTTTDQATIMTELRTKARACKGGTKEMRTAKLKKLIPLLQRCKRYRQQSVLAEQQLSLLDMQINAFENGRFQKEMTDTLRASVVAMKKVGITDSDAGDVDTIVLDMEETMHQQTQISDSLAMTIVNTMEDSSSNDDSLMRELMAMMGDDDDIQEEYVPIPELSVGTSPVVVLPPVPVSVVHAPQNVPAQDVPDIEEIQLDNNEPTMNFS